MRSILLLLWGLLLAAPPAQPTHEGYRSAVLGAWAVPELRLLDLTCAYGTTVRDAWQAWEDAVQGYAAARGLGATLGQVELHYEDAVMLSACRPPGSGDGESLDGRPRALAQHGPSGYQVLVVDATTAQGLTCNSTDCLAGAYILETTLGYEQLPEDIRELPVLDREYHAPLVVFLPTIYVNTQDPGESNLDPHGWWDFALHELGHALGAGHTDDGHGEPLQPTAHLDAMDPVVLPDVRKCVSDLNLFALAEAYSFLPGRYQTPDPYVWQGAYSCPWDG